MSMLFKRIKDWATSITAFRTGDVIPVDGPSGTAKMSKDDLLKETAENALAGNVAQTFDASTNYIASEEVLYNGKFYRFNVAHSAGAWTGSDVTEINNYNVLGQGEELVQNTKPTIVQGEFNYTGNVHFTTDNKYCYFILNATALKTVKISNGYKFSSAFFMNQSRSLVHADIAIFDVHDLTEVDVASAFNNALSLNPYYLVISVTLDGSTTITPEDDFGISFEYRYIVDGEYIIDSSIPERKIDADFAEKLFGKSLVPQSSFEQGEFNYNNDPATMNTSSKYIRTWIDLDKYQKIFVNSEFTIRNYIITNSSKNLSAALNKHGGINTTSGYCNIALLADGITGFTPKYILVSFGRNDGTNLLVGDASQLGLYVATYEYGKGKQIVCFGDSLTASSYPDELQALLGGEYNVVNQGVGGETMNSIFCRIGCESLLPAWDYVLPASPNDEPALIASGWVDQYMKNASSGGDVALLVQNVSSRVNPCWVGGIECVMTRTGPYTNQSSWFLSPAQEGVTLSIEKETPIILSPSKKYRNARFYVVWVGENGGYTTASEYVERCANLDLYLGKNVIFVTTHTRVESELENEMREKFGNRYYNWRQYITTFGLVANGITPTTDADLTPEQVAGGVLSDEACMAQGTLPSSLWRLAYRVGENAKDSTHMNALGYEIFAKQIYNILIELGLE